MNICGDSIRLSYSSAVVSESAIMFAERASAHVMDRKSDDHATASYHPVSILIRDNNIEY